MNYLDAGTLGVQNMTIERSRSITASDLDGSGLLTLDLNDPTSCAPVLVVDSGLTINGIRIVDAGTTVNATAFGDGMRLTLRAASGSFTLAHASGSVSASDRFDVSTAAAAKVTAVGQVVQYRQSSSRWYVPALFGASDYTSPVPAPTADGQTFVAASGAWTLDNLAGADLLVEESFMGSSAAGSYVWLSTTSGASSAITANPLAGAEAGVPGFVRVTSGTAATGRAAHNIPSGMLGLGLRNTGTVLYEIRYRVSVLAADYQVAFGLGGGFATAGSDADRGIIVRAAGNGNLVFASRDAAADVGTPVTTSVPLNTVYQYARIELDSTGARLYTGVAASTMEKSRRAATLAASLAGAVLTTTGQIGPFHAMRSLTAPGALRNLDVAHVRMRLV